MTGLVRDQTPQKWLLRAPQTILEIGTINSFASFCLRTFWQPFNNLTSVLTQNKSRPPAPLPYRPSSAGPSIHRHSSMRHLSSSQNHASEMLAAKKRFTPPPSMSKSMVNKSSISSLSYGNQFRHNNSSQTINDKVNSFFTFL